jgi:hypothetical protein
MDFDQHKQACEKCNTVDITKPATLVNCCLVGAPLLRDELASIGSKKHSSEVRKLKRQFLMESDGNVYQTTKNKAKQAMRYK